MKLAIKTALAFFIASVANANEPKPMSFRVDRLCDGNGSMCAPSIFAEGVIERDSGKKFKEFLVTAKADKTNFLSEYPTVIFSSPGGSVLGGIELGEEIRKSNLDTYIPHEWQCASACALAFLGGIERRFDDGSMYGVHQFSSPPGKGDESMTQITVVVLANYMERMGINRRLLDLASLTPPDEIYWLSTAERTAFRVDNTEPLIGEWTLDSDDAGNTYATASALFAGDKPAVKYSITRIGNAMFLYVVMTAPENSQNELAQFIHDMQNSERGVSITLDSEINLKGTVISWVHKDNYGRGIIKLPAELFWILDEHQKIEIDFNASWYARGMDPTATFSAPQLSRIYPAINK